MAQDGTTHERSEPRRRNARGTGTPPPRWTAARRAQLLEELAGTGNINRACARVRQLLVEAMVVKLTLQPLATAAVAVAVADSGRALVTVDAPAGRTLLAAFEVPPLDDAVLNAPRLTIAAYGEGAGWRRAALLISLDGGASWAPAGATALPATMGTLVAAPAPGPPTLLDMHSSFVVRLANPGPVLADADDGRLDAGSNLALAGTELIQFGRAELLDDGSWRLSRLLRGRRGTEAAAGQQQAGDLFVLLDPETLRTIDLPVRALGSEVRVMATGVGDLDGPAAAHTLVSGASVLPPAPAHLDWSETADGGAALRWVRRSRGGWRWLDGVDAPLAEEAEPYRVVVTQADGAARTAEVAVAGLTVTAAERAGGAVSVRVQQIGTFGVSAPATITIGGEGE